MIEKFKVPPGYWVLEQDYDDRNFYDCSGFETGDRVISCCSPGEVGTLEKVQRYIFGINENWEFLVVYWDNDTKDCCYPAQLLKVREATSCDQDRQDKNGTNPASTTPTNPRDVAISRCQGIGA